MELAGILSLLEKIAWLEGADRPTKEIHEASTKAKQAGHTWREIANARGIGDDHDAARRAATSHLKWHKDNNLPREI